MIRVKHTGEAYTLTPSGWKDVMQRLVSKEMQEELNSTFPDEVAEIKASIVKSQKQLDQEKQKEEIVNEIKYCIEKADLNAINAKQVLATITSKYRKINRPDLAIKTFDNYYSKYGDQVLSTPICTSLAAAFIDLGDSVSSEKFLHMANQLDEGNSEYLKNTFWRLDKFY